MAAVSARNTRGPRLTGQMKDVRRMTSSSRGENPPSGPTSSAPAAGGIGAGEERSTAAASSRDWGQDPSRSEKLTGALTWGTLSRSHCSAASTAIDCIRLRLIRPFVCSVNTGRMAETPSSLAFCTTSSVASRFKGAKASQISGSAACARVCDSTARLAPRREVAMRASHSPLAPSKSRNKSPAERRMTWTR
jgi:hypothetical protein